MNALFKKLAVLCLVLVLASASWAGCCKSKSDDSACGENKKSCEQKDKENKECHKEKSEAAPAEKAS